MRNALSAPLLTLFLFSLAACSPAQPQPASNTPPPGTPQSLEFGHGARLNAADPRLELAVNQAARNGLDWVALELDWETLQPAPNAWNLPPAFESALQTARAQGLFVLVSVQNPPEWVLTPAGPDAAHTAELALKLARLHAPPAAIELFPAANTRAGWGAAPNPAAYARLFETVRQRLEAEGKLVYLAAGGLSNTTTAPEDLRDVDFLAYLYAAGLRPAILSIHLDALTGDPLALPAPDTLRHYEQIRAVMTENGHVDGLLWITRFTLAGGVDAEPWLRQAHAMVKSQLFVGAVFWGEPPQK